LALPSELNEHDRLDAYKGVLPVYAGHARRIKYEPRRELWASLKTKTVCESQRADHPM